MIKNLSVADVIRAPKRNVQISAKWEVGGVPNSRFPLRGSKLHLGRGWQWRTVTFEALGHIFYVLVAVSLEKESYRAILALKDGSRLKVLCHHELHTDHWNWHCHLIKGNVLDAFSGVLRDRDRMKAWPTFANEECAVGFNVTLDNAISVAAQRYRFADGGGFI